jgi:hypothetical protein
VRFAIEQRVPQRQWQHRLAEFNSEMSFGDIKAVLKSAMTQIAGPGLD